jgi:hypothetical protein
MQPFAKLILIILFISTGLKGQDTEIETRLSIGELKMNFPSIYFKHNSIDYATMPYTVDSCFKYIALHINDINDFVIWRDSLESERLTNQRIKKLKTGLNKHKETRNIYIESMGKVQKISRQTINKGNNNEQTQYLLSLNSVFDIAKTHFLSEKSSRQGHVNHPRLWCLNCWRNHRFSKDYRRLHVTNATKR